MLKILLRLVRRLAPFRKNYAVISIVGLVLAGLEMIPPRIIGNLTSLISTGSFSLYPVFKLCALWGGVAILVQFVHSLQIQLATRCGEKVITQLRQEMFEKLQSLSMRFFDQNQTGRILSCFGSDLDALRSLAIWGFNTVTSNGAFMMMSAAMIYLTDRKLFFATVWLAPAMTLLNFRYGRKVSQAWQQVRERSADVNANQFENIAGFRVVVAFNRQSQNLARYNQLQDENTRATIAACKKSGLFQPILQWIRFTGQAVILLYGGYRVISGDLKTGDLVAATIYWDWFMMPAVNFGGFFNETLMAISAADRVFKLLDEKIEIRNSPMAQRLPRLQGQIHFEHVTFCYLPNKPVLQNLNFSVDSGTTVALVGNTGSGKTTIISLLARFYDPQKGRILIDGQDIRNVTLESLRRQVALVLQHSFLFAGTVLDNLRYARPSASMQDVILAAQALGCHERIMSLPKGYLTKVGEKGASLSLGEKQLLCFTRTLIANPTLLLLDEATSALDSETDFRVQKAMRQLSAGRTTFVVTHRLSTAENADLVLLLDHGNILESGSHQELVAKNGAYASLYRDSLGQSRHGTGDAPPSPLFEPALQ